MQGARFDRNLADARRRKAVVRGVEQNGEYVSVRFINDAGEVVQGMHSRVGWDGRRRPSETAAWKNQRNATDSATFVMPAREH